MSHSLISANESLENSKNQSNNYPRQRNGFISSSIPDCLDAKNTTTCNGNGVIHSKEEKHSISPLSNIKFFARKLFSLIWKCFHRSFSRNPEKTKNFANGNIVTVSKNGSNHFPHTSKEYFEEPPAYCKATTMIGFALLMALSFINKALFAPKVASESKNRLGYAPLYKTFDVFYSQYVYRRVRDCWNRPICSTPGVEITLKDRISHDHNWSFEFTGTTTKCINLGSYNYLGFAENTGPCMTDCEETIKKYGVSMCSPVSDYGLSPLHFELEKLTAKFLGVEDAIIFGMGFATNVLNLPCLLTSDCLVISDEKNHASLILSLRVSEADVAVFQHNNMQDLESKLRSAILKGQRKTKKPWRKIFVIVEGVYSMEGSIVHLPKLMELKAKYKFYLYVDEAHSIGAIGSTGRGVTNYFNIDPKEIDILMGTFTKSFNSCGGYIAGSKELVDYIRQNSHATYYSTSMSPPIMQQIYSTMKIIMGEDGSNDGIRRIQQLKMNVRYFRRRLNQMGVIIFGNDDSPVVPLMTYLFSKIHVMLKELKERNIAAVGVGFPATPLYNGRLRFCVSAGHTKEQLDMALGVINEFADKFGLKYSRRPRYEGQIIYGDMDT